MRFDQLLADAGYDREGNHRFSRDDLGVERLIPAKKRRSASIVAATPCRREPVRLPREPGDEVSRRAYRQRWKAGTVMSVIKRRCGEALTARTQATRPARLSSGASLTMSIALFGLALLPEAFDRDPQRAWRAPQ